MVTTSQTMLAVRLVEWGKPPELCQVPIPEPRGTEVLIRVEAAGLCQSDLHLLDAADGVPRLEPPFTLGHEVVGAVVSTGKESESRVEIGARVVVHGPCGCSQCERCTSGEDNYCDRRHELDWTGIGIGLDGGMAEYMLVPDARHLVEIGALDPAAAAPLADAGLTAYHAVELARQRISADGVVVVIGAGGLGHLAVQVLRATTSARVIAVDVRPQARELALACGATAAVDSSQLTSELDKLSNHKADAVLDFVGSDLTLQAAAGALRSRGELVVVGSAGGSITVTKGGSLPQGTRLSIPFWGSHTELRKVIELASTGNLAAEVDVRPLGDALSALGDLRSGQVNGRLVLVP
ncbi:alcohol dehydrogenase catalytic domain-containing protein [Rhodococcus wratislaviensis]|uniref:alcohol dehydrogenase n=1 Tax=Rhodococcus wratislaviensis NBRC 100605 TaxID=1219028 RepID=X0Q0J4_RHOWR|nr:alcohol dehydrogenase catalytic domain-containing protein [Rhodococcus wratislaviensis]GAF49549.1 alcohol dehydrogenase [Rhodococcus wratislaviensis NBRC 100605]